MSEYIKRDDVLSYVYEIRPCKSDYFYIGMTEEKVLDKQAEIADELENLPFVEIEDEQETARSAVRK